LISLDLKIIWMINKKIGHDFKVLKKLGNLAKSIKKDLPRFIDKVQITDLEIARYIQERITSKGYHIAFPTNIGYRSLVCHSTPTFKPVLLYPRSEIIRIDFGIEHNQEIIDTAVTLDICNSNKITKVLDSYEILFLNIELLKPGDKINKIPILIKDLILNKHNLQLVKCLSGHSIGLGKLHDSPLIPNYIDPNNSQILSEGLLFTVEPYVSIGQINLYIGVPTIFSNSSGFICERWGKVRPILKTYDSLHNDHPVIHIEHTFYIKNSKCYRLT
jgi:methionyl aminopeptidase